MGEEKRSKAQLIEELAHLGRRVAELEAGEAARVRVEEALRESEEKYRSLIEQSNDVIYLLYENRFEIINPKFTELFGITPEEANAPDFDFMTVVAPKSRAMIEERMKKLAQGQELDPCYDFSALDKDGNEIIVNVSVSYVPYRGGMATQGILRDISERVRAEEALRESEARNRAILDALPDLMFVQSRDGTFLDYHTASTNVLYVLPEQFLGKKMQAIFPEEIAAPLLDLIEQAVVTGKVQIYEYQLPVAGQLGYFEARIVPHGADKVLSIIRNITARVRAEEALRESEEKLRNIVEHSTNLFYSHTPDHVLTYLSPQVKNLLDYELEEALVKWTELATDNPINEIGFELTQKAIDTGESQPPYELELVGKTGRKVWVEVREAPLVRDGKTVAIVGAATDITARVRVEEERELLLAQIRAQAKQMQQTIDTVPEGVLLLDAGGRVMLSNPVAEQYLALLAEAKVDDILRPGSSTSPGSASRQALTRLGDRPLAELLTSPPAKGLWHEVKTDDRVFEAIAHPVENGPESESWVLVIRDVTQEREIERLTQQQERLAAVGQLAAGIAHDFNNIMAVIVLYTKMGLRLPDIPAKLRERLEAVDRQAKRATDLIQQILDFSRRAVMERRLMNLTPFLKEVVKLLERTVPESIKIEFTYGSDEYTVNADPTRMQQAIMNLVVNARDAMPEGGELRIALSKTADADEVTCVTCSQVAAGEWVRVTVSDTGSGIAPDVLIHIFEPFFTTKEVGKGTGLGLAQVYGIVKQHDGHLDVSTEVGAGTTFTLYLPVLLERSPEGTSLETEEYVQGEGETILVVEDDATLREALADILELLNYRALEAANGREALDILERHRAGVNLVLSDLVMPEMGGQALFHAMRQRGLTQPVVMLSGHPMEKELKGLQEQGLAGWILKPASPEQLAQLLARALRGKD